MKSGAPTGAAFSVLDRGCASRRVAEQELTGEERENEERKGEELP